MNRKITFNESGDAVVDSDVHHEVISHGVVLLTDEEGKEAERHGWAPHGATAHETTMGFRRYRKEFTTGQRLVDSVLGAEEADARRRRSMDETTLSLARWLQIVAFPDRRYGGDFDPSPLYVTQACTLRDNDESRLGVTVRLATLDRRSRK